MRCGSATRAHQCGFSLPQSAALILRGAACDLLSHTDSMVCAPARDSVSWQRRRCMADAIFACNAQRAFLSRRLVLTLLLARIACRLVAGRR